MRVLIAGGTGFIGRALSGQLASAGHSLAILTRDPTKAKALLPVGANALDLGDLDALRKAVAEADALVSLAGAPLAARRWNAAYKEEILRSRVDSTRRLAEVVSETGGKGKVFIGGSAVGFYGDTGNQIVTEESPSGSGFLAEVAADWEQAARLAESAGARLVLARTGIVLGEGGALEAMARPFRYFIGGPLGSGRQWVPWISLADEVEMLCWCLENETVNGPVNLTAPNPVTMRGFARALGKAMGRPSLFPVPGFVLRAVVGKFAETLLGGQKALPVKAQRLGYEWKHPRIEDALAAALPPR